MITSSSATVLTTTIGVSMMLNRPLSSEMTCRAKEEFSDNLNMYIEQLQQLVAVDRAIPGHRISRSLWRNHYLTDVGYRRSGRCEDPSCDVPPLRCGSGPGAGVGEWKRRQFTQGRRNLNANSARSHCTLGGRAGKRSQHRPRIGSSDPADQSAQRFGILSVRSGKHK